MSGLLSLPPEIRNIIWQYVYPEGTTVHVYATLDVKLSNAICPGPKIISPLDNDPDSASKSRRDVRNDGKELDEATIAPCNCLPFDVWNVLPIKRGGFRGTRPSNRWSRDRLGEDVLRRKVTVTRLFLASKQIYFETIALLYSNTEFYFPSQHVLRRFGAAADQFNLKWMRAVNVNAQIDYVVERGGWTSFDVDGLPDREAWEESTRVLAKMDGLQDIFLSLVCESPSSRAKCLRLLDNELTKRSSPPKFTVLSPLPATFEYHAIQFKATQSVTHKGVWRPREGHLYYELVYQDEVTKDLWKERSFSMQPRSSTFTKPRRLYSSESDPSIPSLD